MGGYLYIFSLRNKILYLYNFVLWKKLFKNSIYYYNIYIIKMKALYYLTAQKSSLSLFWEIFLHNFFFYKVTNIHKHIFIKMESPYANTSTTCFSLLDIFFLLLCTNLPYSFLTEIFYSFMKWPIIYLDIPPLWTLTWYVVYSLFTYKKIHYFSLKFFEYWRMNTVHVTTTTIKIQNYAIMLKVSPHGLFIVNLFPTWAIIDLFSILIILSFPEYPKNGVMEDVAFWIWLLSLNIMCLSSINVVCVSISFIFNVE